MIERKRIVAHLLQSVAPNHTIIIILLCVRVEHLIDMMIYSRQHVII